MAESIKARYLIPDRYRESRERARAAIAMIDPEIKRIQLQARLTLQYPKELREMNVELHSALSLNYLTLLESQLAQYRMRDDLVKHYMRLLYPGWQKQTMEIDN